MPRGIIAAHTSPLKNQAAIETQERLRARVASEGYDASYSTALNFMLLAAVMEGAKEGGLSQEARDTVWAFADDQDTIDKLNLHDHVTRLRELWGVDH